MYIHVIIKDIVCYYCIFTLLDLRSQTKPSLAVQELLEAVIIIVKSPSADLSWTKGAKRIMANVDRFREMLMEFSQQQEVSIMNISVHLDIRKMSVTLDQLNV